MNLNIINIGEKELYSAMRSLVDFGKENSNCNGDEVAVTKISEFPSFF